MMLIFHFCWHSENQRPKLWGDQQFEIFQFFHNGRCWYSISIDTQKNIDPNFGGSVIWNFSIWLLFTKWQPFFNFFIMAYSDIPFPLTLRKPETQTLGGVSNLKIFCTLDINELAAIFNFFIMADADIPFLLTLRKPETQTVEGLVIWNFSIWLIVMKWQPFFNFFIMADADIPFPMTFRKPETQTVGGQYFEIFPYDWY